MGNTKQKYIQYALSQLYLTPYFSTECADFHKKSLETIELTAKSQKSKGTPFVCIIYCINYTCPKEKRRITDCCESCLDDEISAVKKDGGVMHPDLSLGLTAQISKWRAKRKGSYLFTLYEGKMRFNRLFNSMCSSCTYLCTVFHYHSDCKYIYVLMEV